MKKENMSNIYTSEFYKTMNNDRTSTNLTSAEAIVPYVLELLPATSSYIDVGGAIGCWASEFKKME